MGDQKNGLLLENPHVNNIQDCVLKVEKGAYNLKNISVLAMKLASQFTFSHYIHNFLFFLLSVYLEDLLL